VSDRFASPTDACGSSSIWATEVSQISIWTVLLGIVLPVEWHFRNREPAPLFENVDEAIELY
jgi:hypothetical protein